MKARGSIQLSLPPTLPHYEACSTATGIQSCKCAMSVDDTTGETLTTNRCAYFARRSGCRFGQDCRYCHVHPVTLEEDKARVPKMEGKKERLAQQIAKRSQPDLREATIRRTLVARAIRQDVAHVYQTGKPFTSRMSEIKAVIGVWAIHRMLPEATAAASHIAEVFNLQPSAVGIWLGKDKCHPSHFDEAVPGHEALYVGIANNLEAVSDIFPDVDLVIICECDVAFSATARGRLSELVEMVAMHPMTMLGFYPNKMAKRSGLYSGDATGDKYACYGTQCWAVQRALIPMLCRRMREEPPDDIDLWFLGRNPFGDKLAFLSYSIAGQSGGRISECSRPGSGGGLIR